jgi:hypothetical protein
VVGDGRGKRLAATRDGVPSSRGPAAVTVGAVRSQVGHEFGERLRVDNLHGLHVEAVAFEDDVGLERRLGTRAFEERVVYRRTDALELLLDISPHRRHLLHVLDVRIRDVDECGVARERGLL